MNITLSPDRRAMLRASLKAYFDAEFDETLSDFRAEGLLDFLIRELGPPIYNQAVRDAVSVTQGKLADLEGELYHPESTR